jgi:hypothetical protein
MKLELEDLAPYLPYGLIFLFDNEIYSLDGLDVNGDVFNADSGEIPIHLIKPILRPLSEYKNYKDILEQFSEYSEEQFVNSFFLDIGRSSNCMDSINYTIVSLMIKHNLDLFGLIEKGLAVDINTLQK